MCIRDRLIECFERVLEELPKECCITCSIGIAVCPRDGENFQTLFRRADVALYQAKACGKKQYQIYDQSMEDKAFGQGAGRKATVNTTIESEQNGDMVLNDLLPRAFNILSKSCLLYTSYHSSDLCASFSRYFQLCFSIPSSKKRGISVFHIRRTLSCSSGTTKSFM